MRFSRRKARGRSSSRMTVEAFAPAKLNLALHVTGRRPDGYHELDSLVAFADCGDRVAVRAASEWSLAVTGPLAAGVPAGDDNLCLRAARMTDGPPAAVALEKHLPAAGGIGGGTSDAAATLRALAALDGRALPAAPERLGADLPVCLHAAAARMSGIGEIVAPVRLPPLFACLVNPGTPVSTAAVFAALTATSNPRLPDFPDWRDATQLCEWLGAQRNDLEPPARLEAPAIGVALARIAATNGCLLSRMSGSGATCFGLYSTSVEANAAARTLADAHPEWWVRAAALS